jgi:hypothetical protein
MDRINADLTRLMENVYRRHISNDEAWNKYTGNNTKSAWSVIQEWISHADKTGYFPNDVTVELMEWAFDDYKLDVKGSDIDGQIKEGGKTGSMWLNKIKSYMEDKVKDLNREGYAVPSSLRVGIRDIGMDQIKMYLRDNASDYERPQHFSFDSYFPHLNYDPTKAREYFDRVSDKLSSKSEALSEYELRLLRHGIKSGYLDDNGIGDEVIQQIRELRSGNDKGGAFRPSNQNKRGSSPIEGYDTSLNAVLTYMDRQAQGKFSFIKALVGDYHIGTFKSKNPFGEDTAKWADRLQMFVDTSMNRSSTFTEDMLEKRGWKDNPVWSFMGVPIADEHLERILADKFPKWYEEKTNVDPKAVNTWIRNMAGLEGKFEFLSLLTSPKSMVNNLFGGTLQSVTHAGFRHWRNAGNQKWLQRHIGDPTLAKWTGDDWDKFVEESGGMDSFYTDLFGISKDGGLGKGFRILSERIKDLKFGAAIGAIKNEFKNNAEVSSIFESMIDKGVDFAKFTQQVIEYKLRKRSWIAHYLKARETLNANGTIKPDYDDQILVSMANKGVEATQFLYNNINRPQFANSAVGSILTRFQTWTYNALKGKADIVSEANRVGFKSGTQEFKKLERMMQIDMSVIALASLFPMSMFSSNVAPPYNYLVDISELIFGGEEDEEGNELNIFQRFGNAIANPQSFSPLGLTTPPITRIALDPIRALFTGEWDRFFDYHLWTWFPFGMPARTAYKTVVNPTFAMEYMTGFPFAGLMQNIARTREEDQLDSAE